MSKFGTVPKYDNFVVGDYLKVKEANGSYVEGLMVERIDNEKVMIDFCGDIKECYVEECQLLVKSDEVEIGDKVEVKPKGMSIFFVGKVIRLNENGTFDIAMEGDDPDDVERDVTADDLRKLMSRRALVVSRWKRAFMLIVAASAFKSIHFENETPRK